MISIGIRELQAHLSRYMRRVERGETLSVTNRGRRVATIHPSTTGRAMVFSRLAADGKIDWSGGKPTGLKNRISCRGKKASDMVIEDREDRLP